MLPQRGLIVNRRKPKDDTTLFPGHQLNAPVYSIKKASVLVGMTFEHMSMRLLGGEERTTNGTADVCPDVIDDKRMLWIESKGCQRGHAFKVVISQLEHYAQARLQAYQFDKPYQVLYCMWAYRASKISVPVIENGQKGKTRKVYKTSGEIIQRVMGSTICVDVLELNVLRRVRELCELEITRPDTCNVKDYASWAGYSDGESYHVLNVGHRFLKRLRENTEEVLVEMGLNPKEYRWKTHQLSAGHITVDGICFDAPAIPVFELVRPEGWREHEGADLVPF